jgi:hypothetical protein
MGDCEGGWDSPFTFDSDEKGAAGAASFSSFKLSIYIDSLNPTELFLRGFVVSVKHCFFLT